MGNNTIDTASNPFFLATQDTNINNVTGDGTVYKIAAGTLNNGAGWSTDQFTAPRFGIYEFTPIISVINLSALHTQLTLTLVTPALNIILFDGNLSTVRTPSNLATCPAIPWPVTLNSGDIVYFNLTVFNSTKTVGVGGGQTKITCRMRS